MPNKHCVDWLEEKYVDTPDEHCKDMVNKFYHTDNCKTFYTKSQQPLTNMFPMTYAKKILLKEWRKTMMKEA